MSKSNRGPRTDAGKAVVSRNATKHGINSVDPVIDGMEREQDWVAHRDGIIESLAPEGRLELDLAEQIALARWRLKRVARYETALITYDLSRVPVDMATVAAYTYGFKTFSDYLKGKNDDVEEPTEEEIAMQQEKRMLPDPDKLNTIMRYEAALHRLWLQTYHELEAIQARRLGNPVNLHRLDVTSGPAQLGEASRANPLAGL